MTYANNTKWFSKKVVESISKWFDETKREDRTKEGLFTHLKMSQEEFKALRDSDRDIYLAIDAALECMKNDLKPKGTMIDITDMIKSLRGENLKPKGKKKVKVFFETGKDRTFYNVTDFKHCGQELVITYVHEATDITNVVTFKNFAGTQVSEEY